MADLGVITGAAVPDYTLLYDWRGYAGGDVYYPLASTAAISGTAYVQGVATGGIQIFLLWRPTMEVIDTTLSDTDGTYSFTGLVPSTTNYVVYFKDLADSPDYNDIVYSLIDTA